MSDDTDSKERFALLDLADMAPQTDIPEIDPDNRFTWLELDLPPSVALPTPSVPVTPPSSPSAPTASETPSVAPLPSPNAFDQAIATQRRVAATQGASSAPRTRVTTPNPAIDLRRAARERLDQTIRIALAMPNGDYPYGCLAAWGNCGEVPWVQIANAAIAADVNPPSKKSNRVIATEAVKSLLSQGYRVDQKAASWRVYRPAGQNILGQSVGELELFVTLQGDELQCEGPQSLAAVVKSAFNSAQDMATIGSAQFSLWLNGILNDWRGVKCYYGYWLAPGLPTTNWLRLAQALNSAGLPVPKNPAAMMEANSVSDVVASGLIAEVQGAITKIELQAQAAKDRAGATLGIRAATTALDDIASMRAKLDSYELLTGPLPEPRAELAALEETLLPLVDGAAMRGSVLELD